MLQLLGVWCNSSRPDFISKIRKPVYNKIRFKGWWHSAIPKIFITYPLNIWNERYFSSSVSCRFLTKRALRLTSVGTLSALVDLSWNKYWKEWSIKIMTHHATHFGCFNGPLNDKRITNHVARWCVPGHFATTHTGDNFYNRYSRPMVAVVFDGYCECTFVLLPFRIFSMSLSRKRLQCREMVEGRISGNITCAIEEELSDIYRAVTFIVYNWLILSVYNGAPSSLTPMFVADH